MIHTMQIQKQIYKKSDFDKFYNVFKLHKEVETKKYVEYKTYEYSNIGINEVILRKINVEDTYKYPLMYLELIINPSKILNKDNPIEILKEQDIDSFILEFNNLLKSFHNILVPCITWSIKRIDFTRNIDLTEIAEEYKVDDIVNKYIELFQRADISSRCKVKYNSLTHRKSQDKGSFTFYNKSVKFIAYDKSKERSDKGKLEELEDAKNILRLEIQCKQMKVNGLKYSNKWDSKFLYHFLSKELSYKTLMKYYSTSVGLGDFYNLDNARKIINNTKVINHKDTKLELIRILELINKKRSVPRAREEYKNSTRFNRYLKKLELIDTNICINPITIPRAWNIDYLPNVWYLKDL